MDPGPRSRSPGTTQKMRLDFNPSTTIILSVRLKVRASSRGVLMGEPDAAPAGVVSQPRLGEAPGRRPLQLRGAAFNGWTRRGGRAAKAAWMRYPRPEARSRWTEKPQVERRVANVPVARHVNAARRWTAGCAARRSIPSQWGAKEDGPPRGLDKEYGWRSVG